MSLAWISCPILSAPSKCTGGCMRMICTLAQAQQLVHTAWPMERLIYEHSVNLGLALDHSMNHTYSSVLNSYITSCDIHHLTLEPKADTLSLFITFMAVHINPHSIDNYLSICSLLKEYYPLACQNHSSCLVSWTLRGAKQHYGHSIQCKLPLVWTDLETIQAS
jgi:hypothetical protein